MKTHGRAQIKRRTGPPGVSAADAFQGFQYLGCRPNFFNILAGPYNVTNTEDCAGQCTSFLYFAVTQGYACSCSNDAEFCDEGGWFARSVRRRQFDDNCLPYYENGPGSTEGGECNLACANPSPTTNITEYCGGSSYWTAFGKI